MRTSTMRTKSAAAALLLAVLLALASAVPASAVYNPGGAGVGYGGYGGPWLGSFSSQVQCVQHSDLIRDVGPWIGRASAYPYGNATQVIWKQTRLERYINGRYYVDRYMPWRAVTTYPGQHATFDYEWFMFLKVDGIYRVTYDIRWYVNGQQIGWAFIAHHDYEINFNPMEGQRIVANGCTMDV